MNFDDDDDNNILSELNDAIDKHRCSKCGRSNIDRILVGTDIYRAMSGKFDAPDNNMVSRYLNNIPVEPFMHSSSGFIIVLKE